MTANSWIRTDDLRESWIFLLLGHETCGQAVIEEPQLRYWEIGIGNADNLVEIDARQCGYEGIESEEDLIRELMNTLNSYRYREITLLTPTNGTLQRLRQRTIVKSKIRGSLRGFTHVAVEEKLERYFDQTLADYNLDRGSRNGPRVTETEPSQVTSTGSVQAFWECWREVYSLIPPIELQGEEL